MNYTVTANRSTPLSFLHDIHGNTGLETLFYTYKIVLIPIANMLQVKQKSIKELQIRKTCKDKRK